MIYLDTSYLVRLYFDDPGHELVRQLAGTAHVACALHGQAETVAAFHRKLREGAITAPVLAALLEQFESDHAAGAFTWLPPGNQIMTRLRQAYRSLPAKAYLRAADATHLATAAANGFKIAYSHDARLLAAAKYFDLDGRNIIS